MKKSKIYLLFFLLVLTILFSACETRNGSGIIVTYEQNKKLSDSLAKVFPDEEISFYQKDAVLALEEGYLAVEVHYTQYEHLKEHGYKLYPIYIETPIIAINRDLTDASINSLEDLSYFDGSIVIYDPQSYSVIAMSYNRDLAKCDYKNFVNIMKPKYKMGKLDFKSAFLENLEDLPEIMIVCDHYAANLNAMGANLELVLPKEGSISYVKALLTKENLDSSMESIYKELLKNGFRTPDNLFDKNTYGDLDYSITTDSSVFPILQNEYENSSKVINSDMGTRPFWASKNMFTNLIRYFVLLACVSMWGLYSYFRLSNEEIRIYVFLISVLCVVWIIVRMMKLLSNDIDMIFRYTWYLFYLGILFIPLVSVWVALATEKSLERKKMEKFKKYSFLIALVLFILVITNDLHNQTFKLNYLSDGTFKYNYGIVMIPVLLWEFIGMIVPLVILTKKASQMPDIRMIIPPAVSLILLVLFFGAYMLFLNNKSPIELTRTIVILVMLQMELCMQFGLIPMNKKYIPIFEQADISMIIKNYSGNVIFQSKQLHYENPDDYSLIEKMITGGSVQWKEDISEINELHNKIEDLSKQLREINSDLRKKYLVEHKMESLKKKADLIERVEDAIQSELVLIDSEMSKLNNFDKEEKMKKLAILGFKISKLKQRSSGLLLSLLENNLSFENIKLACSTIAKAAENFGVETTIFGNVQVKVDFDKVNLMCSWFADSLEKLAFTGSEVVANFSYSGNCLKLTMYTDNLSIEDNPFDIDERTLEEVENVLGTFNINSDDEGYRGIMEVEVFEYVE